MACVGPPYCRGRPLRSSRLTQSTLTMTPPRRSHTRAQRPRTGFTLVEIMIVIVIIGLLAAIAVPGFKRILQTSQSARFINDCRVFTGAAQMYLLESGDASIEDTSTGELPEVLEDYIDATVWTGDTPIGGSWDFDSDYGYNGVGAVGTTMDAADLLAMDERFDDGDLSTGQMRLEDGDRVYWLIDE